MILKIYELEFSYSVRPGSSVLAGLPNNLQKAESVSAGSGKADPAVISHQQHYLQSSQSAIGYLVMM
jgi:hypothetical protein